MSDIKVEAYKKSVAKVLDNYGKKLEEIAKKLKPIDDELDTLDPSNADDKKRIGELTTKREAIQKQAETAKAELKLDLSLIEMPTEANADKGELAKLPSWIKEIIKKKGIPLGKDVSITPDVSFDFKTGKLKSFGITIKW